jgi:hypothetical protein
MISKTPLLHHCANAVSQVVQALVRSQTELRIALGK